MAYTWRYRIGWAGCFGAMLRQPDVAGYVAENCILNVWENKKGRMGSCNQRPSPKDVKTCLTFLGAPNWGQAFNLWTFGEF